MLKRVLIILHLCLAFSIFLYLLGFPFLGAHFSLRSDLLVIESALGKSTLISKIAPEKARLLQPSLSYKRDYLLELPESEKNSLYSAESEVRRQMGYSAWERISMIGTLIGSVSPFLWGWIFLSVYFSVLLLKEKTIAPLILWLLPLFAGIYSIENYRNGSLSPLEQLIPPEQSLIASSESDRIPSSWIEREKSKIQDGWSRFLLSNYGDPQDEPKEKREALAEMRFQMKWIRMMSPNRFNPRQEKQPPLALLLFLSWNLYFAMKLSAGRQKVEKNTDKIAHSGT